jgi:hypothetical protein
MPGIFTIALMRGRGSPIAKMTPTEFLIRLDHHAAWLAQHCGRGAPRAKVLELRCHENH